MQVNAGIAVTGLPPLHSWEDVAALASICGVIFVVAAVGVALLQAITQMRQFGRERAFNSYFRFTKTFSDISHDFHRARIRFRQNDKTLDESAAENYYRRYWHLQLQQWEMFAAGLMPRDIYTIWMLYAADYFTYGRDFRYFDNSGHPAAMTFLDAFNGIGKSVLRNQDHCFEFFAELKAIALSASKTGSSATRDAIDALVRRLAGDLSKSTRWRLS